MPRASQSDIFNSNIFFWNIFGIWPKETSSTFYKYYSYSYLVISLVIYNILLTLNLFYTPLKIELLIREVIFYFTEVAVTSKVLTILLKRNKLCEILDLLDCEEFTADIEDACHEIILKSNSLYKTSWRLYAILSNFAYSSQVFLPIIVHLIWRTDLELPICKFYFLSDDVRETFFVYLFIYQSFGMYGHMMYNVTTDTFIAGIIWMAITQTRVLSSRFCRLNLDPNSYKLHSEFQDNVQMMKLNRQLKHYDIILRNCSQIQDIISATMFVQFAMASAIICVILCGFILVPTCQMVTPSPLLKHEYTYPFEFLLRSMQPSTTDFLVFMVTYLFAMTSQIFLPTWLGTQLEYESQELMFAAYKSEWIPRSEAFKRSIRLFVERAKKPIRLTGLKMFPLSLAAFVSIMKTAYSLFALIRNVQDQLNSFELL